jgi:hypothetical protein
MVVYQRKIDVPPGFVAMTIGSDAELATLNGPVYTTAADAMAGTNPSQQHAGLTYPATVYQKIDQPPGYVVVTVASEAELLALLAGGAVFLTVEAALRYVPPVEQPMANIARTDNFEQFRIGKSVFGVPVAVPVGRENPLPGTFVRGETDAPPPPAP